MKEVKEKVLELTDICEETMKNKGEGESQDDFAYISRQWICRFLTCAEPGPIDNSDFLCRHGSVHPERVPFLDQLVVLLPQLVYNYLYNTFGGCPSISTLHICPACQAIQKRIAFETETFRQKLENQDTPMTHLLSNTWYAQWHSFVKRRVLDPPGPIDNGKYVPGQHTSDYMEISEDVWNFFHGIYGGGPELRIRQRLIQKSPSDSNIPNGDVQRPEDVSFSHGEPMDFEEPKVEEPICESMETGSEDDIKCNGLTNGWSNDEECGEVAN